jgi:hypothetical protein
VSIPALSSAALPWRSGPGFPQEVKLFASTRSTADASKLVMLESQPFSTAQAGTKSVMLALPSSEQQEFVHFPLALNVQLEVHGVAESASISINPGCFVSNMTDCQLLLQPDSFAGLTLRAEGGGGMDGVLVPAGNCMPLLDAWGGRPFMAPKGHQRGGSWGAAELVHIFTNSPQREPAGDQQTTRAHQVGLKVAVADMDGSHLGPHNLWSPTVDLLKPTLRQRLHLQQPGGEPLMLSYRVSISQGRTHLIVFKDRQPPCIVENSTSSAVEVGFFSVGTATVGGVQYTTPKCAVRVAPGQSLECDFWNIKAHASVPEDLQAQGGFSGQVTSVWEDEEDEDSFLDCLMQVRSRVILMLLISLFSCLLMVLS